jgi:hypothetical protein
VGEVANSSASSPTIAVRCAQSGVVLSIDGPLDERASDLLGEVVDAALAAVRRASRIHVDLSRARTVAGALPRVLHRLEQAGATVTRSRADDAAPAGGAV